MSSGYSSLEVSSAECGGERDREEKTSIFGRQRRWIFLAVVVVTAAVVLLARTPTSTKHRAAFEKKFESDVRQEKSQPKKQVNVEKYHFPDMVHLSEHHEEIFGGYRDLEADEQGWMSRNVHVTGADGRVLQVNFKGRYKAGAHFHNLEKWDSLHKFGCTKDGLVLEYTTEEDADRAMADLRNAIESDKMSDVFVSGSQIRRCPKSKEPEEVLNAHDFPEEIRASQTRITQSVRRVHSVKKVLADATSGRNAYIELKTSHANLMDVFADLDFSGRTNMVESGSKLRRQKYRHNEPNMDGILHAERDVYEEHKKRTVYPRVRLDSPFVIARQHRRLGWIQKAFSWIVDKVVLPVVNLVIDAVKSVVSFVKSVVGTIIQPVLAFLGRLIPELVNVKGTHPVAPGQTLFSLNYDASTGKASRIWEIDSKGIQTGPYYSFGKTDLSLLVNGNVVCKNCFVRFHDGWFKWHVVIGGSQLGVLELRMGIHVELSLELDANIGIQTQVTQGFTGIPVPMLSVPLGAVTLGFEIEPEISIGLKWDANGFYYKMHMTGWQEFGVRASMFGGVQVVRDGNMTRTSTGPLIKDSMRASVYVLPLAGLVFSDVIAIEAGLQPTFSFLLKPPAEGKATCALDWAIEFDCPIVVGAWIGLKTSFGMWRLAGFSQAFSLLPTITIVDGCLDMNTRKSIEAVSGVPFSDSGLAGAKEKAGSASAVNEFNTQVAQFNANKGQVMSAHPLQPSYPDPNEKWVDGNGRLCLTACREDAGAEYTSVKTVRGARGPICTVQPQCTRTVGKDYPGNNIAGNPRSVSGYEECQQLCLNTIGCNCWTSEYPKSTQCWLKTACDKAVSLSSMQSGHCTGPSANAPGTFVRTSAGNVCAAPWRDTTKEYDAYKCFCVRVVTKYANIAVTGGGNCGVVCDSARKEPVVAGASGGANIFYICTGVSSGVFRTGFNYGGPPDATYKQQCVVQDGISKNVALLSNFRCACRAPEQPLVAPLRWLNKSEGVSCAETCDDVGQYGVTTGVETIGSRINSYMVCKVVDTTDNTEKVGYTAVSSVDGSYLECSPYSTTKSENSKTSCLCASSLPRYIGYFHAAKKNCKDVCAANDGRFSFPVGSSQVCVVKPGSDSPWVSGEQSSTNTCIVRKKCGVNKWYDIYGGDIPGERYIGVRLDTCQQKCELLDECKCYAYIERNGDCYLKNSCGSKSHSSSIHSGLCKSEYDEFRCVCSLADIRVFASW